MLQQDSTTVTADVKQEVFQRVDALAQKLGVAAEHLWEVLVRQQIIEGWSMAVGLVILIALIYPIIKLNQKADWATPVPLAGPMLVIDIVGGILLVLGLIALADGTLIGHFINPEYFALQEIMEVF